MITLSWVQSTQLNRQNEEFSPELIIRNSKKLVFSRQTWRFSNRTKFVTASLAVVVVVLISGFVLLPTENQEAECVSYIDVDTPSLSASPIPTNEAERNNVSSDNDKPISNPGIPSQQVWGFSPLDKHPIVIGSAEIINSTVWMAVAKYAWQYFEPETVSAGTGLPAASSCYPYFTDWDLGVYIQAIIDAHEIKLIEKEGPWGAGFRLEKVLTFLENRQLTNNSLPFWFYQTENGQPHEVSRFPSYAGNVADSGRLLVALHNLRTYDERYSERVDNIVYQRTNYSTMLNEIDILASSINIYDYLVTSGFAAFWPDKHVVPPTIIDNILSAPKLDLLGVELPTSKLSCEPILLSVFDLPQLDTRIVALSRQVYLAHEAWYEAKNEYRAFSEGPTMGRFAYEWVVLPDGRTWVIQDANGSDFEISPIVFSKVAFSFLALYNTTYAYDLVVHLETRLPELASGYCDGLHENGEILNAGTGNTNGLILSAARYAIQSGN